MKIIFDRKMLCNAFPPLMCAVSTRSTLSAIEGVLIEASEDGTCRLTTYDTDKGIRLCIDAKVYSAGSCIINAQKFSQIIRVMEGDELELTVDERLTARISCGRSTHRMSALAGEDFPSMPEISRDRGFVVSRAVLKKMIAQVSHAMGIDDPRQILNGCYFKVEDDRLTLVACDSFKLAKRDMRVKLENRCAKGGALNYAFIVPVRTVNELIKLLGDGEDETAEIYMTRKYIVFVLGGITFFSRLVDGEYIDYNRIIIRDHKIIIETDKSAFVAALERAALVTEERIAGSVRSHVRLEFDGDTAKISATSAAGSTYDELIVSHEGGNIVIAFNNRYLIDSIRACESEKIRLSLSTPLTSMNIEPSEQELDGEEIFMLLPVRMKE